ncbi:DDE-type integrase/transposase/recombinase [Hyphomonas sp.]|uniref:DDE-type integrase/transposase/recombinase n=1 Tax=Hyphomonas sp. TaxID=87 RepID=UPI003FA5B987
MLHSHDPKAALEGEVLESYVTTKRNKGSTWKFRKKEIRRRGKPEVVVTDRCPSYHAAMKSDWARGAP